MCYVGVGKSECVVGVLGDACGKCGCVLGGNVSVGVLLRNKHMQKIMLTIALQRRGKTSYNVIIIMFKKIL